MIDRSAKGRGPGRLGATYEVRLFDGEVFRGKYMEVDFTAKKKSRHILFFEVEGEEEERKILYGDLEAAIPCNPKVRKQRGLPT